MHRLLINVLKGLENKDSIGLKNEEIYESFVQRIKFFKFQIEIRIKFSAFLSFVLFIGLAFLVSNTIQSLFFGILNAIFDGLWTNYVLCVQLYRRPNKDKRFNTPNELETAYKEVIDDINLNGSATGIGHLPLRWALVNQTEGEYIH